MIPFGPRAALVVGLVAVPRATDRYGDLVPAGAVARCGTLNLGPAKPLEVFAFAPDGRMFALRCAKEPFVRLVNHSGNPTGHRRLPIPGHLTALTFSPTGHWPAAAGPTNLLHVWETVTGRLERLSYL